MKKFTTWACLLMLGFVFMTGAVGCKKDSAAGGSGGTSAPAGTTK